MATIYFLLLSCISFSSSVHARDCPRPVPGKNMLLRDNVNDDTFPDGSKVALTCETGYVAAGGSTVIICTAGNWSDPRITCERKECGAAGQVENGEIQYLPGSQFGDIAKATCNEGYHVVGQNQMRCEVAGWTGRLGRCEVETCEPPAGNNYTPVKDIYEYGDTIRYTCERGLQLNGSDTSSCTANRVFSHPPPKCVRVSCPPPQVDNAQWIRGSGVYGFGHTLKFTCDRGYVLKGTPSTTCSINSRWVPEPPVCKEIPTTPKATTAATTTTTTAATTTAATKTHGTKKPTGDTKPDDKNGFDKPSPSHWMTFLYVLGGTAAAGCIYGGVAYFFGLWPFAKKGKERTPRDPEPDVQLLEEKKKAEDGGDAHTDQMKQKDDAGV